MAPRVYRLPGRVTLAPADDTQADERESGLRMILNFGHTLAHGLEAAAGYQGLIHGEAVAILLGDLAFVLADMEARIQTARQMTLHAARLRDAGLPFSREASIAKLVATRHKIPGWWAQAVTVGYERARGLRDKYQTPAGYQAGASKTVNVPLATLFGAGPMRLRAPAGFLGTSG